MQVPITLVLLVAVGHVASRCPDGKCADDGQTTKRELLEGNYGQRTTTLLNKFASTKPTQGIEYANNLQRQLDDTMVAEHIFGIRLHQIPKISDLLVDNGPPFDVALAHHLYAPVSVYNSRFQPLTSQWYYDRPVETANRDIFSDSKISRQQKLSSEEDNHLKFKELRPPQSQDQDQLFSYPQPDYQFKPDSTQGFSSQRLRPQGEPQHSQTPIPSFTQSVRNSEQKHQPKQYLQQVNLGPVESDDNYEKQVNKYDKNYSKEQGELQKVEATGRPEPKKEPSTPTQGYQHAHPNGAVSYANFIHNHPHSYFIQTDLKPQYKEPSGNPQQPAGKESKNHNNIQAPELQTFKESQGRKIAPPEHQQQYFFDPQSQFYPTHNIPETFIQREQPDVNSERPFNGPFAPISQPQLKPQIYLNPIRQRLLHELQKEHDLQSLKMQPSSLIPSSSVGPNLVYKLESTTYSPITASPEPLLIQPLRQKSIRFPDQSSTQTSIGPLQVTPKPTSASFKPYVPMWYSPPSIWAPELAITPKSRVPHDQIVQATTIVPETLKNSLRNEKTVPEPLDHDNSKLQLPQPTLPSLLVTPLTLQSLSPQPSEYYSPSTPQPDAPARSERTYIQTPQQSVQIQQQEFHEIHSELKPQQPERREPEQPEEENNEHQSLEPQEPKTITTPPSEPTTPDYEIEIAQHVDHSQLPKDLQPVTTGQEDTQPVEQKPQEIQPHPHNQAETQPNQSFGSFGEPPVHLFDRHSPYLFPFLNPFQPGFQPHGITSAQELLQPQFSQSQNIPAFSPVQYFGNYAETIYRNP